MRRHLRWSAPLLLAPALYVGSMMTIDVFFEVDSDDAAEAAVVLVLLLVAVVGPLVCLVLAARAGWLTFRDHRRARGRFTRSEREALERRRRFDAAWEDARSLRADLLRGTEPAPVQTWDVVAEPGERFFLDSPVHYSRYYGTVVPYTLSNGSYEGHPGFVLAGLALDAIGNRSRRASAEARAAAQWREHQVARLLVSDRRLVCHAGGRWLSFSFGGVIAVYPEPQRWTLIVQFHDTEPLMLSGSCVPAAAVLTLFRTHGADAVERHPGMRVLEP